MQRPAYLFRQSRLLIAQINLFLALLVAQPIYAETITLNMPNGLQALARHELGDTDKPAVLLLHGFLQTHNFSTIQILSDELSAEGYTVLAPTLTLNINLRRLSHTCDAIQTHTIDQGSAEIERWVEWLEEQGHQNIVLIGHSSGSLRVLSYLDKRPKNHIDGVILLSLTHLHSWRAPEQTLGERSKARELLATNPQSLSKYTLSYCRNNYLAPPAALLSYLSWDRDWVLEKSASTLPPIVVILGGADDQLSPDWADALRQHGVSVQEVPGADHFFNGTAEFDLQSRVLSILETMSQEHQP